VKTSTKTLFAMRFVLLMGFVFFWSSIAKSQTTNINSNTNQAIKPGVDTIQSADKTRTITTSSTMKNPAMMSAKMGEHAPDIKDPDYAAKKEEWIKNYPEEYKKALNPVPDLKNQ
jgi:hypothetical protein